MLEFQFVALEDFELHACARLNCRSYTYTIVYKQQEKRQKSIVCFKKRQIKKQKLQLAGVSSSGYYF